MSGIDIFMMPGNIARQRRHPQVEAIRIASWLALIWAGLGFIGEDFGDFSGHELPNVGVGYRIEVQPRRNLRLDLGLGYDEIGFYLNFTEAF